MKKLLILTFVAIIFITGCGNINNEVDAMISVQEVNKIIENYVNEENTYIIDVREVSEYEEGHLINSTNIPLSIINTIDIPKHAKIIVYCRSGNRSKEAQTKLKNLGYAEVYDMGGILDWPYDIVQ